MKLCDLKQLSLVVVGMLLTAATYGEQARDPETIFDNYCFTCHGTGWENAPVVGDDYAWEERREQGMDMLLKNTVEGLNGMPPKGGCSDCTTEELRAVIQWMIE